MGSPFNSAKAEHPTSGIMPLSRREFLLDSLASSFAIPGLSGRSQPVDYPFRHGVASGDPLTDAVILWTRISPNNKQAPGAYLRYQWVIARDETLRDIVTEGEGITGPDRDYTVKVDAQGLQPATDYYYAFAAAGQWSDTGHTRTLPEGSIDHLRIAFTSCSNYTHGYFNVYRELAARTDLDLILHLGDYIYEYAGTDYALRTGRVHEPLGETFTLQDYRTRHACYKADKDSQSVHRQHPFIVIWDDHEVANNAWLGGSENHPDSRGDWSERLHAAVRAYYEWMPVREPQGLDQYALYRGYRFGDLLDLSVLDTRLCGRDAPATALSERNREDRTLLGYEQEAWLDQRMSDAQQQGVRWKLTGQQVMVGQLGTNSVPFNYDQWDGYPGARQRLFDSIRRNNVDNWVVLTGDIHSSWAMTLHDDPFASLETPVGVELVTPAVTSEGIGVKAAADLAAASLQPLLPHLEFVDLHHRGYVLLDITHERLQAEWWVVNKVDTPRYQSACLRAYQIPAGESRLVPATPLPADLHSEMAPRLAGFRPGLSYLREWSPAGESGAVSGGLMAARNLAP